MRGGDPSIKPSPVRSQDAVRSQGAGLEAEELGHETSTWKRDVNLSSSNWSSCANMLASLTTNECFISESFLPRAQFFVHIVRALRQMAAGIVWCVQECVWCMSLACVAQSVMRCGFPLSYLDVRIVNNMYPF